MEINLLKCPFCGDQARVYKHNMSAWWSVACEGEDCPMNHCLENKFTSKEEVAEFWNTRFGRKYNPENYNNDRDL